MLFFCSDVFLNKEMFLYLYVNLLIFMLIVGGLNYCGVYEFNRVC